MSVGDLGGGQDRAGSRGPSDLLSREELLGGLPARRASILLFAIEGRTARLVDRSRRAMAPGVTDRSAEARERAFFEAVAEGGELPIQPTIQDLERYAPAWAPLVPPEPAMRAGLLHAIGERYVFTPRVVPALRQALGVDEPAVEQAYARLYGRPPSTAFARELPWRERLRWRRAAAWRRLENLPAVWLAFALTLTETVGGGVLALPIALAEIGPLAGLAIVVVLGVVNLATIGALVEAVTRDGDIRYGSTYFGRLVHGYLGSAATAALTPALLVTILLVLVSFYIGVATTLADVTPVPSTVWAAAVFLAGIAILRRETLDATVATALVVGAVNIALILTIAGLALGSLDAENLRHVDLPLLSEGSFDASALTLAFGVVLACYFGHLSAGNAAKVVLHREPTGRALLVGNLAAFVVAIALYGVFVVAVNGAVDPSAMANAAGTSLGPLAAEVGASVHLFGTVFVVLAMGMTTVHMTLGVANQVREWVPAATATSPARRKRSRISAIVGGRGFWLSMSPVVATLILVEWLLASGRSSFSAPLNFLGTLTMPLVGGIFPMLMLVASRRKGEYVPAVVVRLLGNPVVVTVVFAIYFGALLAYGLVIWESPVERATAMIVAGLMVALTVLFVRHGAFAPRAFVEVRVEEERDDRVVVEATVEGTPVGRPPELHYTDGDTFRELRSVTVDLPESRAQALKLRVHRVTAERESEPLSATVDIRRATDHRELGVEGVALIPIDGAGCRVQLSFSRATVGQ
jgi:Transmembrane amino acid transporter protein